MQTPAIFMFSPGAHQFPAYTAACGQVRKWQPRQSSHTCSFSGSLLPVRQSPKSLSSRHPPYLPKPVLKGPASVNLRKAVTADMLTWIECGWLHPKGYTLFSLGYSTG